MIASGCCFRIADDIRHPRLASSGHRCRVARPAGVGADIAGGFGSVGLGAGTAGRRQRRDPGQVAKVGDKLPELSIRHRPCRHAGVSDAVPDVIENLAIRQSHDVHRAKRGRPRIFAGADLRFSAPVIAVADFALLPEHVLPCRDIGGVAAKRIDPRLVLPSGTLRCNSRVATDTSIADGSLRALDRPGMTDRQMAAAATTMPASTTISVIARRRRWNIKQPRAQGRSAA